MMKELIRKSIFLLAFSSLLFLTACSGSGGGYTSVSSGVYGGYGYPYGNGYDDIDVNIERLDREQRIETRENVRTRSGSSAGMGRPARMSKGGGGRRR